MPASHLLPAALPIDELTCENSTPILVRGPQLPDIDPELLAQIVLSMAHQLAAQAAASDDPRHTSTNDGTDTEAADRRR